MTNKDKKIIKEDIQQLGELMDLYLSQKKFQKAAECLKEMKELEKKLKKGE